MKKLIAVLAMVALVSGAAFAEISVSGHVIGTFELIKGSSADGDKAKVGSEMNRIRLEASGADDDGVFGAWVRIEGGMFGYAWWKPMDMLLLRIGSNGYDGFNSKDGVTRWMFYQTPTDTGVTFGGDNAWGGSIYGYGINFSSAFFGGYGGSNSLMLEFKPIDVLGINLSVPFSGANAEDAYKNITAQVDLNLDFGNIAITFVGADGKLDIDEEKGTFGNPNQIYAYFGMPIGEALALDVGVGFPLPLSDKVGLVDVNYQPPIGIGLGLKFSSDSFGIKFRAVANLGGKLTAKFGSVTETADVPLALLADVMPFFPIGDNATLFISVGVGFLDGETVDKKKEKATVGFHFNPFLQIGSEWGPKFLVGIKVSADGSKDAKDKDVINFSIPIALNVGF